MNMRIKWTDELLELELRKLVAELGRYPSSNYLREMGRNDISVQICRRGGFLHWAERLGVERKQSDSDFGWSGEKMFSDICHSKKVPCSSAGMMKAPFDLLLWDVLRIDVKVANYAEYGVCRGWFYRLGKIPQADVVVLLQHDTKRFIALPWWACPSSNITISRGGGKYKAFFEPWKMMKAMANDRNAEKKTWGASIP